jgi:hypothetical protein
MKVIESKKIILFVVLFASTVTAYKMIYAVNLGGDAATGSNGINYQKDNGKNGYTNSCPENKTISGISKKDEIIYRSVRHTKENFEIAIIPNTLDNGEYLINFKLIECWTKKGVRPIKITINKQHTFTVEVPGTADRGSTLDKYYYFNICDKTLYLEDTSSPYTDGPLIIDLAPEENGMSAVMSALILIKLTGYPVPKSLWPTKDDDLAKISKPFACRTIDEVYIDMHQQLKELSSNITTQIKTQVDKIDQLMTNQNKLESKLENDVKTSNDAQNNIINQLIEKFQQNQKNQEEISSKLVTIFDILNDMQGKFNKQQQKSLDHIDDSEI